VKPGDLIRYNAAGQRNKTLGLILYEKERTGWIHEANYKILLIQWCLVGDLMPRVDYIPGSVWTYHEKPKPGESYWYKKDTYFEVVK
jgi:hypothetical protein